MKNPLKEGICERATHYNRSTRKNRFPPRKHAWKQAQKLVKVVGSDSSDNLKLSRCSSSSNKSVSVCNFTKTSATNYSRSTRKNRFRQRKHKWKQAQNLKSMKIAGSYSSDNSELLQCSCSNGNLLNVCNFTKNKATNCNLFGRKNKFRPRKHKWKQYHKLTTDGRRLDGRVFKRGYHNLSAYGLIHAPNNTNEFIINEHYNDGPDFDTMFNEGIYLERLNNSQCPWVKISDQEMQEMIQEHKTELSRSNNFDTDVSYMSKKYIVEKIMQLENTVEKLEVLLSNSMKEKKLSSDIKEELLKIEVHKNEIKNVKLGNRYLDYVNDKLETNIENYLCRKRDYRT